jgi:hypothetical protein
VFINVGDTFFEIDNNLFSETRGAKGKDKKGKD